MYFQNRLIKETCKRTSILLIHSSAYNNV